MAQSVQRKKMMWYYSAIIDWMIANPGRPLRECAQYVGKTQTTLSIIINSDMFKAALAQRKEQFRQMHDIGLIEKTTKVANAGLDAILETLEKRRDKIPLADLNTVTDGALQRLGYGVKPNSQPGVQVNIGGNAQAQVVLPVSAQDLEEARMALRQVQSQAKHLAPAEQAPVQLEHEPTPHSPQLKTVEAEVVDATPLAND